MNMNILIISGGSVNKKTAASLLSKEKYDMILAADAGLAVCHDLGILPTEVLGDFDSLKNQELLKSCQDQGITIHRYDSHKDYTDTDLILRLAAGKKPDSITLLGASGTRLDHTLANIGLLAGMADEGIPCRILDDHNCVEMLKGPATKEYPRDPDRPYLSVLAASPQVTGITLKGFAYPLDRGQIRAFEGRGISNEITGEKGIVSVESGYLLVIRAID